MNLEDIETRCLNYLRQSKQAVVSLGALREHCSRLPGCEDLDLAFLRNFIRNHVEMLLIEGIQPGEPVPLEWLAEAGIEVGPRVMLKSRVPSASELAAMMAEQLAVMTDALANARADAARQAEESTIAELDAALGRARELESRARGLQGTQTDTEGKK